MKIEKIKLNIIHPKLKLYYQQRMAKFWEYWYIKIKKPNIADKCFQKCEKHTIAIRNAKSLKYKDIENELWTTLITTSWCIFIITIIMMPAITLVSVIIKILGGFI